MLRSRWHYLWLSLLVIVTDQATKTLALQTLNLYERVAVFPSFNLTLTLNAGAAFSFLANAGGWQRWFFVVLALVIVTVLVVWLLRLSADKILEAIAIALIIGGAIGNVIDRLLYGAVVDFLDFYWGTAHWPAFNLADAAIFVGAALLIWDGFRQRDS